MAIRQDGLAPAKAGERAADRIFAVACRRFYRDGIRAVSIDDIVKEAGATKPTLYRAFVSKDALVAAYLHALDGEFWRGFEMAMAAHPGDPRAQLLAFLASAGAQDGPAARGCGLSNAAVEFPEEGHPVRAIVRQSKLRLRQRLQELAAAMGALEPATLADALLCLLEGSHLCARALSQAAGPPSRIVRLAAVLIEAHIPACRSHAP